MVYGEVGQLSLQTKVDQRMINYWLRLIMKDETTIAYQFYKLSMQLFSNDVFQSSWLRRIKTILDSCGLTYVWQNQDYLDVKIVKLIVAKRLEDIAIQKWYTSISVSPMCEVYKEVKLDFGFEQYLLIHECKYRIQITKCRCRNTKLPIKTCTYNDTTNICTLCDMNCIGDEYHYLFVCPNVKYERELYIKKYYYKHPSMGKMKQLMCSVSNKELKNLAKFCTVISKRFK